MDPQLLLQLIEHNLQTDNAVRKRAEQSLGMLYHHTPDQVTNLYLDILAIRPDATHQPARGITHPPYLEQIKQFAIVQLKNCLSARPKPPYVNIWPKITEETQNRIKKDFFDLLMQENNRTVAKILAGTIGKIAANLMIKNQEAWPEFKPLLIQIFTVSSDQGIEWGFHILETFYEEEQSNFKDVLSTEIHSLLATGLEFLSNQSIGLAAMKCFSSYLLVLDHKNHPLFQDLIPRMLKNVVDLAIEHKDNRGLTILANMLDLQPRFFKIHFQLIVDTFVKLYQSQQIPESDKKIITQILVDYSQVYPALFRNNLVSLSYLLDMVVMHMLQKPKEISNHWLIPPEGFDEDHSDQNQLNTTRYGMDCINKIIDAVGKEDTLMHVDAIIEKLLSISDWRYQYCGLMIMSQIGEYLEGPEKAEHYLTIAINSLSHDNPMLRYAACHIIGLFSQDLKPKFQQKYGKEIFNHLTAHLFVQPAPRVLSHIQGVFTNFLQGVPFDLVSPQFPQLITTFIDNAEHGISIVKESALSALTSLAEIAIYRFEPYLQQLFAVINKYFQSEQYFDPCYNNLRGQALQSITFAAVSVRKMAFKPYLRPTIELLIALQHTEKYQPPLKYIINSWQRLTSFYPDEIEQQVDRFLPQLLEVTESSISEVISSKSQDCEDDDNPEQESKTHRISEIENGITMLRQFSEHLPCIPNRYLLPITEMYSNIIKHFPNEDTKECACSAINKFIACIPNQQQQKFIAKRFISDLVLSLESNRNALSAPYQVKTLIIIFQLLKVPFLTLQQLTILTDKLLLQFAHCQRQKQTLFKESEDLDEDQIQNANQQYDHQEEIQYNIVLTLGEIFKLYQTDTVGLAKQILSLPFFPKLLESQQEKNNQIALFLIDDIVQYVGYQHMQDEWPDFEQILTTFLNNKKCTVRQAACYGLGVLAQQTPANLRSSEAALNWLNQLEIALKTEKRKKDKLNSYLYCRDNIVAAIGKIMRSHIDIIHVEPFLPIWLLYLPLLKDTEETEQQTQFLIELIIERQIILSQDCSADLMIKIIQIFSEVIKLKLYQSRLTQKIKISLQYLLQSQPFLKNSQQILKELSESHKKALLEFFQVKEQSIVTTST